MKKLCFLFFSVLLIFASSCSKDDASIADEMLVSFKANGNAVEIRTTNGNATAIVDGLGSVTILGVQQGGNGLNLKLSKNTVGKYNLGDVFGDNSAGYLTLSNIYETENVGDGVAEITSSTATRLKGKFYFSGTDFNGKKATISEGIFDLPITK